jgi:hypothetical protein
MFELLLGSGQVVRWAGRDGVDACSRYADAHRDATVLAWREPRAQIRIGWS